MISPNDITPRRSPRYLNHVGKLLVAMVLFVATQTVWLLQDIQDYRGALRAGLPASAHIFEIFTKPTGEVTLCTSTADGLGTSNSRPKWIGKFSECEPSDQHIELLQKGGHGCFSFLDAISADAFMGCVVAPLLDPLPPGFTFSSPRLHSRASGDHV